jgi:PAS domain S-box-containing protein
MHEVISAHALRESEERHRVTLLSMSDAVFITTDEGAFTFVCPNVDVIFGYREDEVRAMGCISQLLGRDLLEVEPLASRGEIRNLEHEAKAKDGTDRVLLVHIKRVSIEHGTIMYVCRDITERKRSDDVHRRNEEQLRTEFRALRLDDVERWVLGKGEASNNGRSPRMPGVFLDAAARHRMEQELRDLGGRLVDAHERERRRLSAELHDGVGQRLAVLAAELALLREQVAGSPLILEQVDRVLTHAEDVGSELHRLSHDLHPAWLEQVGLSASIRRVCDELSRTHRIVIHLEIAEVPGGLTNDVALCLYRIVQEALHNVVKHSSATTATVRLEVDHGEVLLNVVDDGRGLDLLVEHATNGVGLISMRERARQVEGSLTLTSSPGLGTQVQVRVPLVGSTIGERRR